MQFQVPQFIDVEDKIIGPFSFKQFAYIAGGLGLSFVLYKLLPFWLAVLLILPVLALAGALTFVKVNEKPFIFTLEAWFGYIAGRRLYVWQKDAGQKQEAVKLEKKEEVSHIPKLTEQKLEEIAKSLDVQGKY